MGLDGVELVMAFEATFGITISDEDASEMLTPGHVIDFLCEKLADPHHGGAPCLTQKVFYRTRRDLVKATGSDRGAIRLEARLLDLFPKPERHERWQRFLELSELEKLPKLTFGTGRWFQPITVRDLVDRAASEALKKREKDQNWSRAEIREAVRQIIRDELGIQEFSDGDHFIRDLD